MRPFCKRFATAEVKSMFDTPHRNHPSMIAERVGSSMLLILLLSYNVLTAGSNDLTDLVQLSYWQMVFRQLTAGNFSVLLSAAGVLLILSAVLVFSVFRWSRTFFHIQDGMLFSERRTLMRKHSKLPVSSITTVNIEQNIFEKIIGTAKVKIDINSAVTANKTDFIFILKKEEAQQLKEALLSKRNEEKTDDASASPKTLFAAFSIADAVRHKLLSVPFVEILMAVIVIFPMFFGESAVGLSEALPLLGISLLLYGISLVFGILNYAHFRLEADEKRIYISHGMLQTHSYAFEKDRVKAVFLKQSLLARLFGLCSVELAVVGLGNEKNESPRLCLLVKKDRAEALINTLLPVFSAQKEPIVSSKAALIPSLLLTAFATAACSLVIFYYPLHGYILTISAAVFGVFASILSQKTRTVSIEDELFCSASGILNKSAGRIRYRDLQEVRFHTNAIMQKRKTGRIGFSILAARNIAIRKTGWFSDSVYEDLCTRVLQAPDTSDI